MPSSREPGGGQTSHAILGGAAFGRARTGFAFLDAAARVAMLGLVRPGIGTDTGHSKEAEPPSSIHDVRQGKLHGYAAPAATWSEWTERGRAAAAASER